MLSVEKLYNYLFFSFFLIFIRVVPVSIETQPVFSVLFSLLILSHGSFDFKKIKTDVLFTWLLMFVLVIYGLYTFLLYKNISVFLDLLKYLIGPIIYLAMRKYEYEFSFKTIRIVVASLFIVAIITLLFPGVSKIVFGLFISRSENMAGDDYRGITILTPEPSYFSVFVILLMTEIERKLSLASVSNIELRELKVMKILVLLMAIFTKSVFAILIAIIFFLPLGSLKKNIGKLLIGIALVILSVVLYVNFNPGDRITLLFDVISTAVSSDEIDFLDLLFYQESSGGARFIINWLAVSSFFEDPFGKGIGTFPQYFSTYATKNGLDLASHDVFVFADKYKFYPQTYLANLIHDIGVFSLLLVFIIVFNWDKSNARYNAKLTICLFFLLFFQSQLSNPALWYLIASNKAKSSEIHLRFDSTWYRFKTYFVKCLSR